jgi:hypothetical protein
VRSRRLFLIATAPVLWVLADLYFRVNLPGAAALQHLAFRAAARLPQWLPGGEFRARNLAIGVVVALLAAAAAGRRGLPVWRAVALLIAVAELLGGVVALLMERAVGGGIVVGVVAALIVRRGSPPEAPPEAPSRAHAAGVAAVGLVVGVPALLYLHGLFAADSDGYLTLDWLRFLARTRGGLGGFVLGAGGVVGLAAAALVARRPEARRALATGGIVGIVVGCLAVPLLDPTTPFLSILVLTPAGVALALASPRLGTGGGLLSLPVRLAPLAPIVGLLVAHTYAVRVFGCPELGDLPDGVERISDVGEVFQIAVGAGGGVLAMTHRSERRIGRLEVRPTVGELGVVAPGDVIPAPGQEGMHPVEERPLDSFLPGATYARPEELLYAPEAGRFFGTLLSADPKFYEKTISPLNDVNNMIVAFDGRAEAAEEAWWESRQCWIGTLFWDAPRRRLLLGCEYEAALLQLDPATGVFAPGIEDPALGDVAGIAVDTRAGRDSLWVVSMWNSARLTELGADDLAPRRSVLVGSGRYALAFDAPTGRLFTTAYYRSRVRILDADTLSTVGTIRTGLGARALAVDSARGLVLASSVYDGIVRICGTSDGKLIHRLKVGGHVKDITIDSENGLAYFSSQCGMFRVDLERIEGRSRKSTAGCEARRPEGRCAGRASSMGRGS